MRCFECFHYNACGSASMYVDTEMCKQALSTKSINDLKEALAKAQRDISNLKVELEWATRCIDDVEDALYRGNNNDWAQQAIDEYRRRNDDSL